MSRGPRRTTCAWLSMHGFRQKLNGKRRREGRGAVYSHGVKLLPTPHSPCSGNTTSMKSLFSPPWIRLRLVKALMAFTIWQETSLNGYMIGLDPTTTLPSRTAIRRARQVGATRASAAARGRVTRSCFERQLEVAQHRISVQRRSGSDARNHQPRLFHNSQQSSLFLVRHEACASISLLW